MREVTDINFNAILHLPQAVIYFYSTTCGPCAQAAPTMQELANFYAGHIPFFKADIEKTQHFADLFNVKYLPTVLMMKNGQVNHKIQGMTNFKDRILNCIKPSGIKL